MRRRAEVTVDGPAFGARRLTGLGALFFGQRIVLDRSPLARKIIAVNFVTVLVLGIGMILVDPFRDSLVSQRSRAVVTEAELIAEVFEVQLRQQSDARLGAGIDAASTLGALDLGHGYEVIVLDPRLSIVAGKSFDAASTEAVSTEASGPVSGLLAKVSGGAGDGASSEPKAAARDRARQLAMALAGAALDGKSRGETSRVMEGSSFSAAAAPILRQGEAMGVVALVSDMGPIDGLIYSDRMRVLQIVAISMLVSIGLSLVLASTIARPLSDLAAAAAAESERDADARFALPGRIRIPDLSDRPDEIGQLSGALRGMVTALYARIDANEQFAADVAHEIKNPLASLCSAVCSLRLVRKDEQRALLLDVIEHDVQRLDRLVSDISNASRLDSELVKDEEDCFDLLTTLRNLADYLADEAQGRGIELIADLPAEPIRIMGLESRLAQVFVNLLSNAISFCGQGDAIRIWARQRDDRVLVVVEDTGPGIAEAAEEKIFARFYSERPAGQFGNNSGLGLAISKQIVEAHGGVIWAENIPPREIAEAGPTGARFVVGLPL